MDTYDLGGDSTCGRHNDITALKGLRAYREVGKEARIRAMDVGCSGQSDLQVNVAGN